MTNGDSGRNPEEVLSEVEIGELLEWIEPVSPKTDIAVLVNRLRNQVEDVFPVTDRDVLVGIVTGTDLAKMLSIPSQGSMFTVGSVTDLKKHLGQVAQDVMTPDPISIDISSSLWSGVEIMVNYEFRNIPVTQGRTYKGVLSMRDVLLFYCQEQQDDSE